MHDTTVLEVGSEDDSQPLSDAAIQEIHDGLLIPNELAVKKMAREIRKWRGVADPDAA